MFIERIYWIWGKVVAKRGKRSLPMPPVIVEKTKWWSGELKTLLIDRSLCCWHNWDDCLILSPSGAVPRKVSPVLLLTTCWCLVDSPPTRASSSQAKNHGLSNLSVPIYHDGRPPSTAGAGVELLTTQVKWILAAPLRVLFNFPLRSDGISL